MPPGVRFFLCLIPDKKNDAGFSSGAPPPMNPALQAKIRALCGAMRKTGGHTLPGAPPISSSGSFTPLGCCSSGSGKANLFLGWEK